MRKKYLVLSAVLLLGTGLRAQTHDPSPVRLVNTGRMAVAPNSGATALYVPYSVWMTDPDLNVSNVSILHEGVTSIGGSFYQDSKSNVFQVDNDGWGTSTGTIVFSHNHAPKKSGQAYGERTVRTRAASDMDAFERASQYVAFPHVRIATNDTIRLAGRMGIDASSIAYLSGNEKGIVYLSSDVNSAKTKVYDASLRISAVGISDPNDRESKDLVAAGSVIVEKDVSIYRSGSGLIFPFAAPFTNLRVGYYSGNFVRRMIEDPTYAGHVTYVLGNRDSNGDGTIDSDQYVVSALEELVPGKTYLVKPRTSGFDYSQLHFDLTNGTASGLYDKGKFVFDGNMYNLAKEVKQLYAEDELFKLDLSGEKYGKTVNLIIGNSYTSAISMEKLYDEMASTGLNFSTTIYYFLPGSATWMPYNIATGAPNFTNLSDIPANTAVMLRLSREQTQTGTFTIGRAMQTHGEMSSNMLRSGTQYTNELLFTVSPEENLNVKDVAMIALRPTNSGSITKIVNPDKDIFQLAAGDNRSIAVEPEDTKEVPLTFRPSTETGNYVLSVSRVESMMTEAVLLEDRLTDTWIDLRSEGEYTFSADVNDSEGRFFVHFSPKDLTGLDDIANSPLRIYYSNGTLHIRGLVANDVDAPIRVSDMQGRSLVSTTVSNYPEETIEVDLSTGVYLVHLAGDRNQTVKVLVKGGGQ